VALEDPREKLAKQWQLADPRHVLRLYERIKTLDRLVYAYTGAIDALLLTIVFWFMFRIPSVEVAMRSLTTLYYTLSLGIRDTVRALAWEEVKPAVEAGLEFFGENWSFAEKIKNRLFTMQDRLARRYREVQQIYEEYKVAPDEDKPELGARLLEAGEELINTYMDEWFETFDDLDKLGSMLDAVSRALGSFLAEFEGMMRRHDYDIPEIPARALLRLVERRLYNDAKIVALILDRVCRELNERHGYTLPANNRHLIDLVVATVKGEE